MRIKPEYSAQASIAKPNPYVETVIRYFKSDLNKNIHKLKIGDQGAGKLRHLPILRKYFKHIFLIDTETQMNKNQLIFYKKRTIKEYIDKIPNIVCVSNINFQNRNLDLDIIFNICTFDVVLPNTRREMLLSANKNLKKDGFFILIIPRNDQSILVRCGKHNCYRDGHIFYTK